MGIWDSMKKMAQPYDNDYDDYDDEENEYAAEQPRGNAAPEAPAMDFSESVSSASSASSSGGFAGKVVNMSRNHPEIRLVAPTNFREATAIAKHLCDGCIVHLNVENTEEATARRVIDFLSGCVFALKGKVTKAGTDIYMFTPDNVVVNTENASVTESAEAEA